MAVEDDDSSAGRGALGGLAGAGDALAASIFAGSEKPDAELKSRAARVLDIQASALEEQAKLARLQSQNLVEQNQFELSHLRWRRLNDQMRGVLQIMAVLMAAFLVTGLSALLWNAHEAKGLVVEPLQVPPDFDAKGLNGTVLAQRLLDKLNRLVAESEPASYRSADAIAGNWGDDSKVEIPETGVSAAEFTRALRAWLGSETHATGEIWHSANGISVTVRAGSAVGNSVSGADADLDRLLDRAAEQLLAQTQPYRWAAVLAARGRYDDAIAFVKPIALNPAIADRGWAYTFWANEVTFNGNNRAALLLLTKGAELDPADPSNYFIRGGSDIFLGREEDANRTIGTILRVFDGPDAAKISPTARAAIKPLTLEAICRVDGDFLCAAQQSRVMAAVPFIGFEYSDLLRASSLARAHDGAGARALLNDHSDWNEGTAVFASANLDLELPFFFILANREEWHAAVADASAADRANSALPVTGDTRHTFVWPWLAYALARDGQTRAANGLIALTPRDCDECVAMRGRIAAFEGDDAGAKSWFEQATRQAPSLPYAFLYWGEMLLHRGDYAGAIAKFAQAHEKGPHFADPLEMWGEALMQENRSDLALAKFEEANKYAPNWGRQHLELGKALWWSGDKQGAKQEFANASNLDLSVADRQTLVRVNSLR